MTDQDINKLIRTHGIENEAFYDIFDIDAYIYLNNLSNINSKFEGLVHFIAIGIYKGYLFSFNSIYDFDFYREYNNIAIDNDYFLYLHYINYGIKNRYLSSNVDWKRFFGLPLPDNEDLDLDKLALGNIFRDKFKKNKYSAIEYFLQKGFDESLIACFGQKSYNLLHGIGDYHAIRGNFTEAKSMYIAAISRSKDKFITLHALADIYNNQNDKWTAIYLYSKAYDGGFTYIWTVINLVNALTDMKEFERAKDILLKNMNNKNSSAFYHWKQINNINKKIFEQDRMLSYEQALEGHNHQSVYTMQRAINKYIKNSSYIDNQHSKYNRIEKNKILIASYDTPKQCFFYRAEQKYDFLKSGECKVDLVNLSENNLSRKDLIDCSIIIFCRVPALPHIIDLILEAKRNNSIVMYDIDDLIFDDAHYPPEDLNSSYNISKEVMAGIVNGISLYREMLFLADIVITSTNYLSNIIKKIDSKIRTVVIKNALDSRHMKAVRKSSNFKINKNNTHKIIIFYGAGAASHQGEFDTIVANPIEYVMRNNGNVHLRIVGDINVSAIDPCLSPRIEKISHINSIEAYWDLLEEADINIAPLRRSVFNDSKSQIKWLEAAMLGVPSVVSKLPIYEDFIEQGINGLIASNEVEWTDALMSLISGQTLRMNMGLNAKQHALALYSHTVNTRRMQNMIKYSNRYLASNNNKPTLLLVNVFFSPNSVGGATRIVEEIAFGMSKIMGHLVNIEVVCVAPNESDIEDYDFIRYVENQVTVTAIKVPKNRSSLDYIDISIKDFFINYLTLTRPMLIHFHCIQMLTASVIDAALETDIPYIITIHDGWWLSDKQFLIDENGRILDEKSDWGDSQRLSKLKYCLLRAKRLFAVSKSFLDICFSRGIINAELCENGVSDFSKNEYRKPESSKLMIGFLGGLSIAKGGVLLQNVISSGKFFNLSFIIVDDSKTEFYASNEKWGQSSVTVIGRQNFNEVRNVYSQLNVLVAPSVCVESFGLVTREAAQQGIWVVASDRGGIGQDIINDVNGWRVNVENALDLLKIFNNLNENYEKYKDRINPTTCRKISDMILQYSDAYNDYFTSRS